MPSMGVIGGFKGAYDTNVLSHSILSFDQYSGSIDDETLQRLKQLREQAAEIELLEAIPALDEALESL